MSRAARTPLLRTPGQWIALAICGVIGVVLFTSVDLDPEVRADFFFELDDDEEPARAEDPLGVASQVLVAVRADSMVSSEFLQRLYTVTEELGGIEGVALARSLTHGPEEPDEVLEQDPRDFFEGVLERPFWSRLLLAPDRSASVWSMLTNLLGFGSLLFVEAKPLREFGLSGAIATAAAMACAYLLFPPFLRAADPGAERTGGMRRRLERTFTARHPALAVLFLVAALAPAVFISRIDTDPALPRYFGQDSRIRNGIEAVDRAGGSSPLDLWVADASGDDLVGDEAFERLEALHHELEDHPDVGSALSIALLMAETQQPWYSFLIPWEQRLQALESSDRDEIGRAFITENRRRGRYVLRMREEARSRPRLEVVGAVLEIVRQHGFQPVSVGGLYPLQGELSRLVETSVERSLGALLIVFCVIAFLVVRSVRAGVAMAASLALMPFALFGCVGLFRMPMEFLSAPAANIALALGIDESIHLAHTARRRIREGAPSAWDGWKAALAELWYPIVAAMLIVGAGFSLFLLSNFPPTRHLGLLVALGVVIANLTALLVLPTPASRRPRGES